MPRNYIRKKIKTYTPEDLAQAIEKVKKGELTQYSAARQYKIPMTTLYEHVNQSKETTRPNAGRPTVIPLGEEKKLAETIITLEKWGFGLSRFEIMELVSEYVRVNNIKTPFKNNVPGPDWFINFRKRHRLSIKKAQPVEFVRRKMTDPFIIAEYFDLLKNTLTHLNLFESPQFIWNLDETSICLDPSRTKVVGQKNKPCSRTTHGSGKENITILTGASASGKKLPPLIIFKGKFVWDQWMADVETGEHDFELSYAASSKGWMETEIFYNYVKKVLIPNLGQERPVLIIYDGHATHVDVRVVHLAIQNQITILKLPPHTSHLLQPLDIAVFKSFKSLWDAKLVEWQRRNIGSKMPKKVFSQTLADTWQQTNPDIIKSGFKKAGIYPFNAHVIPEDKYDPDAYKRYQKTISGAQIYNTKENLKNPKTLKKNCIDFINYLLLKPNDAYEKPSAKNVIMLSQLSKSDIQTLSFVAKQPTELPMCLKNIKPLYNQTPSSSKINIISDIVIQKAFQSPLQTQPLLQPSCTFEELVLRKIQQDKKNNNSTKKKRVTKGAEVITANMGKKILEGIEKSKHTKAITKTKVKDKKQTIRVNKKDHLEITSIIGRDQPGPSNIKKSVKRKRRPSIESLTSVSDIMSEHSDSDIIDCLDFDKFSEEFFEDDLEKYNEEPRSHNKAKDVTKIGENNECDNFIDEKILTNKDLNYFSTVKKGKGLGKKSKGKENQVDKKDKENDEIKHRKTDEKDDINGFMKECTLKTTQNSEKNDENLLLDLKNEDMVYKTQEEVVKKNFNNVNDSVLVRYLIRKKWRYYIGFIEEIIQHEERYFSINFLKTTRRQQKLTFTTTKRKDSDKVPEYLIVKKIEIYKKSVNDKDYYLCNDEDSIYFD